MKIIRLSASNVMRLKAVEIEPNGTVQIVAGRNGAGKSSLLNAIWLALGGGAASREIAKPVRAGEETAEVTLDFGDLTVTRTWENGKTSLVVRAADGARYPSPQTLLDQLVGKLSFDPLAFTRLPASGQRQALLDLLGLDFTDVDRERARLYDERLDTGRRAHAFGDLPRLDRDAPMVEVSASDILDRIRTAQDQEYQITQRRQTIAAGVRQVDDITRQIETLTAQRAALETTIAAERDILDATPEPENVGALRDQLAGIEVRNAEARDNQRIAQQREEQKALQEQYTRLTHAINTIDQQKADAIAAAAMPVDGLGFDESGVLFRGVPFAQASSAEQIRVSLAMAMALNPTVRVIRIVDGSLLDDDSMAEVYRMAEAADAQVWIERVADDSDAAVVIEDGQVVAR